MNIGAKSLCEYKIDECIDFLVQSKIYIGNDTGFMHLSASLGLHSYGLFGDTPLIMHLIIKKLYQFYLKVKKL